MQTSLYVRTYGLSDAMMRELAAAVSWIGSAAGRVVDIAPVSFGRGFDASQCGCIISALVDEASAPAELLDRLADKCSPLAVVYLAERSSTKAVVEVMRKGACEVLEWPGAADRLDVAISHAVASSFQRERELAEIRAARLHLAALTRGERDVLLMMLDGMLNKNIAKRLDIALRTVEARRKRVLKKLGANNAAEVAGALDRVGLLVRSTSAWTASGSGR